MRRRVRAFLCPRCGDRWVERTWMADCKGMHITLNGRFLDLCYSCTNKLFSSYGSLEPQSEFYIDVHLPLAGPKHKVDD